MVRKYLERTLTYTRLFKHSDARKAHKKGGGKSVVRKAEGDALNFQIGAESVPESSKRCFAYKKRQHMNKQVPHIRERCFSPQQCILWGTRGCIDRNKVEERTVESIFDECNPARSWAFIYTQRESIEHIHCPFRRDGMRSSMRGFRMASGGSWKRSRPFLCCDLRVVACYSRKVNAKLLKQGHVAQARLLSLTLKIWPYSLRFFSCVAAV